MTTFYTVSGDLGLFTGGTIRDLRVMVRHNSPDGVHDPDTGKFYPSILEDIEVTTNAFSVQLMSTDAVPGLRYTLTLLGKEATGGAWLQQIRNFPLTANADLADLIETADPPITFANEVLGQLEAYRDEIQALFDAGFRGPQGPTGPRGYEGWEPVTAVVADGERRVLQVIDWTGGDGTKPTVPTDNYVGTTGLTNLAGATDLRGATGPAGSISNLAAELTASNVVTGTRPGAPNVADIVDNTGSTSTYREVVISPAGRMVEGIKADGTKHLPVAQADDLTVTTLRIGTTTATSAAPPALDSNVPSGSGYLYAVLDSTDRVTELALDDTGRVPNSVLSYWKCRSEALSDRLAPMDIFLGGGQSNLGSNPDPVPGAIALDPIDPRIFYYDPTAGAIRRLADEGALLTGGLAAYRYRVIVTMAETYIRRGLLAPGRNILIVNGGLGSTGFTETNVSGTTYSWDRTNTTAQVNLYTRLVSWANAAKGLAPTGSTFAGLVWQHGETDSDAGNLNQTTYSAKLDDLIATLRTDLATSTLPVAIGTMVPNWIESELAAGRDRRPIANALEDTPRRVLLTAVTADVADLPDYTGSVHYAWQAGHRRGQLMCDALYRARLNASGTEPVPPQSITARRAGPDVLISWEHPPCALSSFTVETKIDSGSWTAATLTNAVQRSVTVTLNPTASQRVYVRARTTNPTGTSVNTKEFQA